MDEQPRKSPEAAPEVGPEAPGSRWLTMPAIGALLGMSERAARDWVRRHDLPIHGRRPMRVSEQALLAQMAAEERVARKAPEAPPEAPGRPGEAPGSGEPIEAEYRVTPEELQRAIERTGTKYVTDFTTLYESINAGLAELYQARLAERDLALSAKDQALAAKDETIAELRRRAEHAEAARDRLTAAQAAQDGPGAPEVLAEAQEAAPSVWGQLRRWWRG